jgi:hypothetical protein
MNWWEADIRDVRPAERSKAARSARKSAFQSEASAEAKRKVTCRGSIHGGYDVFVSRPNGSDIKIGRVRRHCATWEALHKGRILHKGSRFRRDAVAVLISAWESQP